MPKYDYTGLSTILKASVRLYRPKCKYIITIVYRNGDLRQVVALQTTEYLTEEDQWAPWYATDQTLAYVNLMLSTTFSFGKYKVILCIIIIKTMISRLVSKL